MKKLLLLSTLVIAVCRGQESPRHLLTQLQGKWLMTGTVMSKPVTYSADGEWVLQEQFLAFHMRDTSSPPAYEATLFIGIDSAKNEFVAHWLDSFGGAGARVVGNGPLSADRIEIAYPYEPELFRNLFRYDAKNDRWTLVIESQEADQKWALFARYTIVRP